jgi:hypothetical protein
MSQTLAEMDSDRFSSVQNVAIPLPGYRGLIVKSGTAQVDFGGGAPGSGWTRGTVSLQLDLRTAIGQLTADQSGNQAGPRTMAIEQSAVQAALSSFTNAGQAVNVGWAVDGARLVAQDGGVEEVQLDVDLAVSDDSLIYRISFSVTLIGTLSRAERGEAAAVEQVQRDDG